jgi:hypothetical protein
VLFAEGRRAICAGRIGPLWGLSNNRIQERIDAVARYALCHRAIRMLRLTQIRLGRVQMMSEARQWLYQPDDVPVTNVFATRSNRSNTASRRVVPKPNTYRSVPSAMK